MMDSLLGTSGQMKHRRGRPIDTSTDRYGERATSGVRRFDVVVEDDN